MHFQFAILNVVIQVFVPLEVEQYWFTFQTELGCCSLTKSSISCIFFIPNNLLSSVYHSLLVPSVNSLNERLLLIRLYSVLQIELNIGIDASF